MKKTAVLLLIAALATACRDEPEPMSPGAAPAPLFAAGTGSGVIPDGYIVAFHVGIRRP